MLSDEPVFEAKMLRGSKPFHFTMEQEQVQIKREKSQAAGGKPAGAQGGKGGDDASAASTQATNAAAEEEKKVDENVELEGRLGEKQWLGGDQPSKEDADRFAAM